MRCLRVIIALMVWWWLPGCDHKHTPGTQEASDQFEEQTIRPDIRRAPDKPTLTMSQAAPAGVEHKRRVVAITASGEEEENAQEVPVESESRGGVELEPEMWNPNAFIRPRRRMTIDQLERAILTATGGIGWEGNESDSQSRWQELAPTLGVADYFRRTRMDLNPSMTFQKFLGDGANVVCTSLMIHEQNLTPGERVFFVHVSPDINPNDDPQATDTNLQMLLLRFHGKHIPTDSPEFEPWRNLVKTIAANAGPWFGDWMEAWTATCIALMKHPDFYSY